mgnify:FL=1
MKVKHTKSVPQPIHCKVCHTNAMGVTGHIGKHHKACTSNRNDGRRKGQWVAGNFSPVLTSTNTLNIKECMCGGRMNVEVRS